MDFLTDQNLELIKRLGRGARRIGRAIAPGRWAWRGAAWGALVALTVLLLVTAYGLFGQTDPAWFLVGTPLFLAAFALAGGLLTLIWRVLKGIPTFYVWVLASAVLVLANLALTALSVPVGIVTVGLGMLALASLVGAGFAALTRRGWSRLTWPRRAMAVGGLVLTLMMGVLTDSRNRLLGVSLGTLLGGLLIAGLLGNFAMLTPWSLVAALPAAVSGTPLPMSIWLPIGVTAGLTLLFVAVALFKFERTEF